MRVLIDGLDLSGKSTLAGMLTETLQAAGLPARRGTGSLHPGRAHRLSQRLYRRLRPGSPLTSLAFVGSALADLSAASSGALDGPEILVQEAYVSHSVAFAEGLGNPITAAALRRLRPHLPRFDLVLYLTASLQTRLARAQTRGRNDASDRRLLGDPALLQRMDQRLGELLMEEGAWRIDTDTLSPEEVLEQAWLGVLGRMKGPLIMRG